MASLAQLQNDVAQWLSDARKSALGIWGHSQEIVDQLPKDFRLIFDHPERDVAPLAQPPSEGTQCVVSPVTGQTRLLVSMIKDDLATAPACVTNVGTLASGYRLSETVLCKRAVVCEARLPLSGSLTRFFRIKRAPFPRSCGGGYLSFFCAAKCFFASAYLLLVPEIVGSLLFWCRSHQPRSFHGGSAVRGGSDVSSIVAAPFIPMAI